MQNLKARLDKLEQAGSSAPIVVIVAKGETREMAFTRAGIDEARLPHNQLVIIVDRGCSSNDS